MVLDNKKVIKIIFIAGDGRSGSTLLDTILSNIEGSISVGECHRFWVRFAENESHCACSKMMQDCTLWSEVERQLQEKFPEYHISEFEKKVREIQFYKNFKKIPSLLQSEEWKQFAEVVKAFYKAISEVSGSQCIIDSSKSIPWAYVLQQLDDFDVRVIHLERNLTEVANSWKKTVRLPEYTEREVFMPKKGNVLVAKTWLKIKLMGRILKRQPHYSFVTYRALCKNPKIELQKIMESVDENIPLDELRVLPSHAIGGNPMRSTLEKLEIKNIVAANKYLSIFDRIFFNAISGVAKIFLS
jgi:hypothetical protein